MEVWKTIEGFEYYQVSTLGRVKSIARDVPHKRYGIQRRKESFLKQYPDQRGYLKVKIYNSEKPKTISVHQLVSITFLNHKPCGHKIEVDHINEIKTDNRVENLQLLTVRDHSHKNGGKGSSNHIGVSYNKVRRKWQSYTTVNGKKISFGYFKTELEASQAYQAALKEI